MTEQEFADAVKVTRAAVQQWEREGGTAPTRKNQPVVAAVLGISVAELLGSPDTSSVPHRASQVSLKDAIGAVAESLMTAKPAQREQAATLLQGLAREPDGPWAGWLTELLCGVNVTAGTSLVTSPSELLPDVYSRRPPLSADEVYNLGVIDTSEKRQISHGVGHRNPLRKLQK